MLVLLFFAFLSGLVTILAPCIWPLLPIILSASTTGGHKKPLGITLGIMLSFSVFTLSISYLVMLFHFDPDILRFFAVIIIGFLGFSMVIPAFLAKLELVVGKLTSFFSGISQSRDTFNGGLVTGLSLGIVWSPCAGPILATIATLAATQALTINLVLVTIAYVAGVGIPLFFFSYTGGALFSKSRFINKYTKRIQQIFGIIMLLTALAIYTNYDKVIQAKLLDVLPSYSSFLTGFEKNQTVQDQLDILKGKKAMKDMPTLSSGLPILGTAVDFNGGTKWFNTQSPLSIASLKGKVVLVDFWTYTCINCIRTLPHVTSWYSKYRDQGFVVIGVHTPEFEFEKKEENVLSAIQQYGIHYPVVQDNNYAIWNAYGNQYWPAEYLIDANGNVRRTHFGEGEYDQTEQAIVSLLKEKGAAVQLPSDTMADEAPKTRLSPETYVGSKRMEFLFLQGRVGNGFQEFTLPQTPEVNSFMFGGQWNIMDEYALSGKNASITYNFYANKVFLVMRPPKDGAKIKVFLDGKEVDEKNAGEDVKGSEIIVGSERLYKLIQLSGLPSSHILKLEFLTPGTFVYAFTFG